MHTSAMICVLQIIDDKQLLKRYQKEIINLKEELHQIKRGTSQEDLISIREGVHILYLWNDQGLSFPI
jgi:hypothetical protein